MRQRGSKKIILTLLALCLSLHLFVSGWCCGSIIYAAAPIKKASEYEIKAVYLYNFLLFAKWPESDEKGDGDGGKVGDQRKCDHRHDERMDDRHAHHGRRRLADDE